MVSRKSENKYNFWSSFWFYDLHTLKKVNREIAHDWFLEEILDFQFFLLIDLLPLYLFDVLA